MKKRLIILVAFLLLVIFANPFFSQTEDSKRAELNEFNKKFSYLMSKNDYYNLIILLEEGLQKYPEQLPSIGRYLGQLYAITGKSVRALDFLENCISKNVWYDIDITDENWRTIAQTKRFKKIVETFNEMKEVASKNAKPLYDVVTPPNYTKDKKYPLFIGIHSGGGNMTECKRYLTTEKIKTEYIAAYIQSSQPINSFGFTWRNLTQGSKDVVEMFDEIVDNYSVDTEKIVLCGMSEGGGVSLFAALNDIIPCKGAITFCTTRPAKLENNIIKKAVKRDLKVVIVVGDQDPFYTNQQELENVLRTNGLQLQYIIKQGLGHDMPDDYKEIIDSSLEYIFDVNKK
jgi:predicted esterase